MADVAQRSRREIVASRITARYNDRAGASAPAGPASSGAGSDKQQEAIVRSSPSAHDLGCGNRGSIYALGWQDFGGRVSTVVTGDDPAPRRIGPDDPAHNSARELIEHVIADRVTKPARDAVRKALDAADAPPQGKLPNGAHRAPEGLGKALGRTFANVGLRTGA